MKKLKSIDKLFFIVLIVYALLHYILFYNQCIRANGYFGDFVSDFDVYLLEAQGISTNLVFPHKFLFIFINLLNQFLPIQHAGAASLTLLFIIAPIFLKVLFNQQIFDEIYNTTFINRFKNKDFATHNLITFLTFSLLFVSSILIYKFDTSITYSIQSSYLQTLTPNVYHNATGMAARSFSLVSFYLFSIIIKKKFDAKGKYYLLAFAIVLFLSLFTKPTFSTIYLPVFGLYMLFLLIKKELSLRNFIYITISFFPSLILLLYQFYTRFGSQVQIVFIFDNFFRYDTFTNLIKSSAFPLLVLFFNLKDFNKNVATKLAWFGMLIAIVQRYFVFEAGDLMYHGNFLWGYMLAIFILFVQSTIVAFKNINTQSKQITIALSITYNWHLISGLLYFSYVFLGGKPY